MKIYPKKANAPLSYGWPSFAYTSVRFFFDKRIWRRMKGEGSLVQKVPVKKYSTVAKSHVFAHETVFLSVLSVNKTKRLPIKKKYQRERIKKGKNTCVKIKFCPRKKNQKAQKCFHSHFFFHTQKNNELDPNWVKVNPARVNTFFSSESS